VVCREYRWSLLDRQIGTHLGSATSGTISEPDPSRSVFAKSTAQLDEAIFPILYRTLPFLKAMGPFASLEVNRQRAS